MRTDHPLNRRKKTALLAASLISATFIIITASFIFVNNPENASYLAGDAFPALTFDRPVGIYDAHDGTNRLFVVEQMGRITFFINDPNSTTIHTFLDIHERVVSGGELGLLGLAFHPNFKNNGLFYVDYTADSPLRTVFSRFSINQSDASLANASSELLLLSIAQPFQNHNGGQLAFGPDGFLYIGMGDGGSAGDPFGNGQNKSTLLGKILRIDVDGKNGSLNYGVPLSNPFSGNVQGFQKEIFAFGLRNPWRFSFDNLTGDLWCADVGQDAWEEVDVIVAGGNYGWNIMEGNHCYAPSSGCNSTGLMLPAWEYSHNQGDECIVGGVVYRGSQLLQLEGKYICGDFISGRIWALDLDGTLVKNYTLLVHSSLGISSFGIDATGELLICAFDGKIHDLVLA
nr:PQQ-dependent sugar dehydrogenase [Candidatus Sigynarchaeota archaeon]